MAVDVTYDEAGRGKTSEKCPAVDDHRYENAAKVHDYIAGSGNVG